MAGLGATDLDSSARRQRQGGGGDGGGGSRRVSVRGPRGRMFGRATIEGDKCARQGPRRGLLLPPSRCCPRKFLAFSSERCHGMRGNTVISILKWDTRARPRILMSFFGRIRFSYVPGRIGEFSRAETRYRDNTANDKVTNIVSIRDRYRASLFSRMLSLSHDRCCERD